VKILLVRPPEFRESAFAQMYPVYEGVGLGYIAASLRGSGHDVEILDARVIGLSVDETAEKIASKDADVIGFTLPSGILMPQASAIIKKIREMGVASHISLGGQYPTFAYHFILTHYPTVDSIVRFEGDLSFPEVVDCINDRKKWNNIPGLAFRENDNIVTTPSGPLVANLDTLPFPTRDTLPEVLEQSGVAIVASSRGCYAKCKFCSVRSFYRPEDGKLWRGRSAENVFEEIHLLKEKYDPDELWFADDNLFGPGKDGSERVRSIFQLMKDNGVQFDAIDFSCRVNDVINHRDILELAKQVGLRTVYVGVESGVQRILDIYHKGTTVAQNREAVDILREIGIVNKMEFIFFNPWITLTEVKENLAFLKDTGIYDPYMLSSTLTIHTYSPLWQDILSGKVSYEQGAVGVGEDFDPDSYRPYAFEDNKVHCFFQLVAQSFEFFEPVYYELWRFKDTIKKARKLRCVTPEKISACNEVRNNLEAMVEHVAMDLFEEGLTWVEDSDFIEKELVAHIQQFRKAIKNIHMVVSTIARNEIDDLSPA